MEYRIDMTITVDSKEELRDFWDAVSETTMDYEVVHQERLDGEEDEDEDDEDFD